MPFGKEQVRTIIVMGTTGSGKSETIKQLGGKLVKNGTPPDTSRRLLSCTQAAAIYNIGDGGVDGAQYRLVDTRGMADTAGKEVEALEEVANLLEHRLSTLVGVIYVVTGRMTPEELELCNFLVNDFFHDLDPSRLLVLRTKVNDWQSYNAEEEKNDLRQQEGVPERFLAANFVAVDFHPAYEADVIEKMTERILQNTESWKTHVKLSKDATSKVKLFKKRKAMKTLETILTVFTLLGSGMGGAVAGGAAVAEAAAAAAASVTAAAGGGAAAAATAAAASVTAAGAAAGAIPVICIVGAVMAVRKHYLEKCSQKKC